MLDGLEVEGRSSAGTTRALQSGPTLLFREALGTSSQCGWPAWLEAPLDGLKVELPHRRRRARLAQARDDRVAPDCVVLVIRVARIMVVSPAHTVVGLLTRVRALAVVTVCDARLEDATRPLRPTTLAVVLPLSPPLNARPVSGRRRLRLRDRHALAPRPTRLVHAVNSWRKELGYLPLVVHQNSYSKGSAL